MYCCAFCIYRVSVDSWQVLILIVVVGDSCFLLVVRSWLLTTDQITIKTPNPKGRLFLKINMERDLAADVYLSEAPSPPRFLFGVVKQFCRFGICSNTQCITPVDTLHTR
jgi:hypothetical protein